MPRLHSLFAIALVILSGSLTATKAQENQAAPGALPEVALSQLSDRNISPLGQSALAIRANDWKHAETANFVYHFFHSFIATPVSVEAEFYYRNIAKEMEKDTAQWERKSHVFIFEDAADWKQFQSSAALDPWTGGIHAGGELFIRRDPSAKWKGNTLGHEVAHLVVHRFFGNGIPLWLKEGHAEYTSSRGYAAFHRARGYSSKPRSNAVNPAQFIPLAQLTTALTYPQDVLQVGIFYDESERLVRFLSGANKQGFGLFFEALSKGAQMESALSNGYGSRFSNLDALEREFKAYATKEHGTSIQD